MAKSQQKYAPLDVEDPDSGTFLPTKNKLRSFRRKTALEKLLPLGWVVALILFVVLCYQYLHPRKPTDLDCTRQLNAWSPVYDVVEYEDVQFSNTFYQPSRYRGKPTPELEKAWSDLWMIGTVDVPFEKLPLLNKSKEDNWAVSKNGGVLAGLEVFHTMHCLDMIRQYTHKDEYDYSNNPTFQDDEEFVRLHVDHCIEALRIRIMCYADVTPFLHTLTSGAEMGATPDFNTQHRCKKYDKIQEWQRNHKVRIAEGQGGSHEHL